MCISNRYYVRKTPDLHSVSRFPSRSHTFSHDKIPSLRSFCRHQGQLNVHSENILKTDFQMLVNVLNGILIFIIAGIYSSYFAEWFVV